MIRFTVPREVNYGWGSLSSLKYLEAKKALIITDKVVEQLGYVAKIKATLKEKNIGAEVFNEVTSDPSMDTIKKASVFAQDTKPDVIIGLGGGSTIDTGKLAWVLYEHPDLAAMGLSDMSKAIRRRVLRRKATYIAIPSTSGTGSEVTCVAVVTDDKDRLPLKTLVVSIHMVPDVAIVDAEIASTMPPALTADTGYDALTHAIEGYLYTPSSDIIDALAVRAARTILDWLPRAVEKGNDVTTREKMHMAATMSGMVISNGGLGLVHDSAHLLGGIFKMPHGRACALMLCQVIGHVFPSMASRISELAKALGLKPDNERDAAKKLIAALESLKKQIGLPSSLKEAGVNEKKFMAELDEMSRLTVAGHPERPTTLQDARDLYLKAWLGAKVEIPSS
jgi:alcohol dehydrogenase